MAVDEPVGAPNAAGADAGEGASVISPLSDEMAPERDLSKERDERVIPVAKALLKTLASRDDLMLGSAGVNKEDLGQYYAKVYQEDVITALFAANLYLTDITYLFSIMQQVIQLISDVTTQSLEMNTELAGAKLWGVDDLDDLRLVDVQKVLTGSDTLGVDKKAGEGAE